MPDTVPQVDVSGVGLNATDTIIRLPHFPSLDSKVEIVSSNVLPGGQVASAMVACQSWGLSTRYIGKVGSDPAADLQRSEFARAGVEAHLLTVPDCASQLAFILVDQLSGERTILWQRDPRLTVHPEELRRDWITRSRILLLDGHDTAAATLAARWAREASLPVVADVDNLYTGVEALLENVDYLVASRDFPTRLISNPDLKESLRQIHCRFGCRVVSSTLGIRGVLAFDGSHFHYAPAFRVNAVDTTGAGDIFHGAFVYAVLQGWGLPRMLDFSCAAAALNCTVLGARGGIRPLAEIEALVRSGPRHPSAFNPATLNAAH